MNPTLFDVPPAGPQVRAHDPAPSRLAQQEVARGNAELVGAVRWWLSKQGGPRTAFEISAALCGARWSDATVRSAVSRAKLREVDRQGRHRNRPCWRYVRCV